MVGHPRPASGVRPGVPSSTARAQPACIPVLDTDPTRSELPADENGDPVPILFFSDGSSGVTGDSGDLVVAVPNSSSGVDVVVASDISASITLGIDSTGLL